MKIALCTTTIHVPHALKLLRKCSDDVRFFVVIDKKTHPEAAAFCNDLNNVQVISFEDTKRWKCFDTIDFHTTTRRNMAYLHALEWGADVIYAWDDDNFPVNRWHFDLFYLPNRHFDGLKVGHYDWFDPGSLLFPVTRHRGFPYNIPHRSRVEPVTDAKLGVVAGLVLGDPDVDATTRIEHCPDVTGASDMAHAGVVVDLMTWTVFNSQNTAVIRELMPAWFLIPGVGRYEDIYASLIVQRVARKRDLHVYFGPPFTYQQRNEHNLITNLRAEIHGMDNVTRFAQMLDSLELTGTSVINDVRIIYMTMRAHNLMPLKSIDAALLWLEDCETML